MRLIAVISLSALLFASVFLYCFRGRRLSERLGALYLLLAAVAFAALLVSAILVDAGLTVRPFAHSDLKGHEEFFGRHEGDPSGNGLIISSKLWFPKPETWTADELIRWQENLRNYLKTETYGLDLPGPGSLAPQPELQSSTSIDGLILKLFYIPARDGDSIPAVLLMPEDADFPLPGIVLLHGHVESGQSGLAQMVFDIDSYHQSAARRLAQAGFATITPELRGFGMRGPPEFPDHRVVAYNAIMAGSFYKKLVIDDIARTLEVLRRLPEVDSQRIGMAGVSLGGEIAVEFAALDPRIRAVSIHSQGGAVGQYRGYTKPHNKQPHYCHIIPRVPNLMHREDPYLLLAPRPVQGLRGEEQPFANRRLEKSLREMWRILGTPEHLDIGVARADKKYRGHAFFVNEALTFF